MDKKIRMLFLTYADANNYNAQSLNARDLALRLDQNRFISTFFYQNNPDQRLTTCPHIRLKRLPRRLAALPLTRELIWGEHDIVFYLLPGLPSRLFMRFRTLGKRKRLVESVEATAAQMQMLSAEALRQWEGNLQRADARYAITDHVAHSVSAKYGIVMPVVPIGVNTKIFQPVDRSAHQEPWKVLFVGSLQPRKQPEIILELARQMKSEPVEFHLIGAPIGNSSCATNLLVEKERDDLQNVHFHGAREQIAIAKWMADSDVLILPSRLEGLPKVTLEAAATGLPSIIFDDYQTPSVVDGKTGFQVKSFDEMLGRLRLLLKDRSLRTTIGAGAVQHAKNYDWDRIAPQWQSEFEHLLNGSADTTADTEKFRREMGKISRQSGVYFAGTVSTLIFGFAFKIYVSRMLGAHLLGIYALGMSVISFLALFGSLGLPQSASRFVSLYNRSSKIEDLRHFLWRSVITILFMTGILSICAVAAGPWLSRYLFHEPVIHGYLALFALMLPLNEINFFLAQVLRGYQDVTSRTVIANFVGFPFSILLTVVFFTIGWGLTGYIAAQIGSTLLTLTLLARHAWKLTPLEARRPVFILGTMQKEVSSFARSMIAFSAMGFLLTYADRLLLGVYLDAARVGIYSIAFTTAAYIPTLLQSVNAIFGPVIADLHAKGETQLLNRLYQTLTKWILGFTAPLIVAIIIFAPTIMTAFGKDFAAGALPLIILAIAETIDCGVGSVGFLLMMSGNQTRLLKIQAIAGVTGVALNLLMIPAFGIVGAAIISAATLIATNLASLLQVRSVLKLFPYNKNYLRLFVPFTASMLPLLVARLLLGSQNLPRWWIILIATAVAYLVFIVTAMVFSLDDDDRLIGASILSRVRRFT